MAEATMTDETTPHLFGIAKVDDADTLRQMLGGWFPGIDTVQESDALAGVQANGDAFLVFPGGRGTDELAYPVRVLVATTLPAQQVKDPDAAKPYRR